MSEELETSIAIPMNDVFSPDFQSKLDPRFRSDGVALPERRIYKRRSVEEIEKPW